MQTRDDPEVTVGSVWYVWGQHQEVLAERPGANGREVRVAPVGAKNGKQHPWVEAWRVSKHGRPSAAYSEQG